MPRAKRQDGNQQENVIHGDFKKLWSFVMKTCMAAMQWQTKYSIAL